MANKIRLGFIGANVKSTLASQSHFPALRASPDVEIIAVCTTRPETADEAVKAFGAKHAFPDFREMVSSREIDAVAVVVRVPSLPALDPGSRVALEIKSVDLIERNVSCSFREILDKEPAGSV